MNSIEEGGQVTDDVAVLIRPDTFSGGTLTYRIFGLDARASSISNALTDLVDMIETRREIAETALEAWRGPKAVTFVEDANSVLADMTNLGTAMYWSMAYLSAWPGRPPEGPPNVPLLQVTAPFDEQDVGAASADPDKLRDYVSLTSNQDERLPSLAGTVSLEDVTGEVAYSGPLASWGQPFIADGVVFHPANQFNQGPVTTSVPNVSSLVLLDSPEVPGSPLDVTVLKAKSDALNVFTSGVADEFEDAGDNKGGPGGPGGVPGDMGIPGVPVPPPSSGPPAPPGPEPVELPGIAAGEALGVIAGRFSMIDRPEAEDPETFGLLTREELALAAENDELPPDLRAAALRVAQDPELFAAVAVVHQPLVADPDLRLEHVSLDDITTFLDSVDALDVLREHAGVVDLPEVGGQPDGIVSLAELEAAANDVNLAPEVSQAARFMLHHPVVTQRLAQYDALYPSEGNPIDPESLLLTPILDSTTGEPVIDPETGRMQFDPAPFSVENLERMAADHEELVGVVDEPAEPTSSTGAPGSGRMVLGRRDLLTPDPESSTGDPALGRMIVGERDYVVPEHEAEPEPTSSGDAPGSGRTAYMRRLTPDPTVTA